MNIRKQILKVLLISTILLGVGIVLTDPEYVGLCRERYTYTYGEVGNTNNPPSTGCKDPLGDTIGQPIAIFSMALIVLSLSLLIFPKGFHSWLRFAKYYIPIAALIVVFSPTIDSSILGFDKEFMSWFLSGTFLVASLVITVYKWFREKN